MVAGPGGMERKLKFEKFQSFSIFPFSTSGPGEMFCQKEGKKELDYCAAHLGLLSSSENYSFCNDKVPHFIAEKTVIIIVSVIVIVIVS